MARITDDRLKKDFQADLLEYWRILVKRRWAILSVVTILAVLSLIYSFTATPVYKAISNIMIEEPTSSVLTLQDILSQSGSSNGLTTTFFNTQLKILGSRTLAERVAKKMNLAARPELQAPVRLSSSLFQNLKSVLTLKWLSRSGSASESANPQAVPADPYSPYVILILKGISISPITETNLVEVSYKSIYPRMATDIVNMLVDEFVRFTIETRYEATQQTSEFLNEQIAQIRDELAAKEKELQRYGEDKKLLSLNDKESSIVSKYTDVTKAYTEATIKRIKAEADLQQLRTLDIDSPAQFVGNSLVQTLRADYAKLKSDYDEKSKMLGPGHPDMIQLKAKMDSTKSQLQGEVTKAIRAQEAELRAAQSNEGSLKALQETQRADVSRSNSDGILYGSLQADIESKKSLLNQMVSKQEEAMVSARMTGMGTSYIKIVDRAVVPDKPFGPIPLRNAAVALILGLVFGVGFAFLADFIDNTIKEPEDMEHLTGLPSLGVIPQFAVNGTGRKYGYISRYRYNYRYGKARSAAEEEKMAGVTEVELINHLFPRINIAEDYRTVRTSIMFSLPGKGPKAMVFTSSSPQEGKSATVANLGISFAQLGVKVVVVDADLRKPRQHKIFKVKNTSGLSDYLTGRRSFDEVIQKTAIDSFWVVPSGPHPPNPAELLNSEMMKDFVRLLKERFDVVLIDTPPVMAVIDPVIVSSYVDSTVIVLRTGKAARKPVLRTVSELRRAQAKIIGVVFNGAKARVHTRYGRYTPNYMNEYYQEKPADEAKAAVAPRKSA
jgi:capsular exopolysaccharide synthesis family protein